MRRAWLSNGSLIILAATAFVLADLVILYIAARGDFAIDFTCCTSGRSAVRTPASLYAWTGLRVPLSQGATCSRAVRRQLGCWLGIKAVVWGSWP
jgi:hypothetical protein